MRHLKWMTLLMVTVIIVVNSSCSDHELFDAEVTQAISDSLSPVDSIDLSHNWSLTETRSITVTANTNVNARWLKILTADPRQSLDAEVATQVMISDGETATMSFCYPNIVTTLYAALEDDEGRYTVTAFSPNTSMVDFSDPLYTKQIMNYVPQPQVFVYCYEEEMPDYTNLNFDYNDAVLSISYERTGEREIRFHVWLDAVGTDRPMSAALHLKNFKYDEIESVTTEGGASFNVNSKGEEIPEQVVSPNLLRDRELLLKSNNKEKDEDQEAVINLFCDAHWATGDLLPPNDQWMIDHKHYNVSKSASDDYRIMVPKEVTYIVTFKESKGLENLNFDLIDPFIIKEYLGGTFEVHQFAYRNDWVLKNYKIAEEIVKLPWALIIPYKKFRHPLDEVNIGFKKKDIQGFGAYSSVRGHTFGEWSMDHNLAHDWYLNEYATENQVY